MASQIAKVSFLAIVVSGSVIAQDINKRYSPLEYFKNYALSTCIADGYKSDEVIKDSSAAARGYLELGSLPLEAHTKATLLGRKYLQKEYKSISGEPLTLMKCIDFYHSEDLDRLAKKYRNKR